MWRIEIPPPLRKRPWLTMNDRDHWGRRKSLSTYFREYTCREAVKAGIPPQQTVLIDAYLAFGDHRRRDSHNWMPTVKACIDGLVDADVLPDDSDKFIRCLSIQRDENNPKGISLAIH